MERLLCALACFVPPAAPGPAPARYEFRETHMGTEFKILLYTTNAEIARRACRAAFDRVAALDGALSDYDPESELMRLCDRAGGPPVAVSADLFDALSRSVALAERSGGAFDPTVNPVVRLWRRARRERKLPDPAALARARALVDYRRVELDAQARTVRLGVAKMKLDLGGIAKGYAAEAAMSVLKQHGLTRALVAAAGDIVVIGSPPGSPEGWPIAIEPIEPGFATPVIRLKDGAVSTSGDSAQFVEIDGVRYSHIVDPRTGLGLRSRSSTTIVAQDGATSDGLGTAVSVLGPERGLRLVEETPGTAAFIQRVVDGRVETVHSRRWAELAQPRDERPAQDVP